MRIPKVIVDGLVFESDRQVGIWRLFYETMSRTSNEIDYTLLLSQPPLQRVPPKVRIRYENHRTSPLRRVDLLGKWKRKSSLQSIAALPNDAIWHSTYFTLDPNPSRPSVVTVYDMLAERYLYYDQGLASQKEFKQPAIVSATKLLAISHATANDLEKFYPATRGRIGILPLGSEHLEKFSNGSARERRHCLFVGARLSYKNFGLVLDALKSPHWPSDVDVDVAGPEFTRDEKDYIGYVGVGSRLHHLGRLSDAELSRQYHDSLCFIFPSLIEGFGLPILESQRNECLPVISDIPAFREVAGDAAIFFDPRSPDALASAVAGVRSRKLMPTAFEDNLKRYSWDQTAESLVACYRSLNASAGARNDASPSPLRTRQSP